MPSVLTMTVLWTEERVRYLHSLWIAVPQISTRDIGILCKRQFGVDDLTKNSVIGKVHRFGKADPLGWPLRPSPITRKPDGAPPSAIVVSTQTLAPLASDPSPCDRAPEVAVMLPLAGASRLLSVPPPPRPVPVMRPTAATSMLLPPPRPAKPVYQLPSTACCWPIGEPRKPGFHFCGDPSLSGKPYCSEHAKVAFVSRPQAHRGDLRCLRRCPSLTKI